MRLFSLLSGRRTHVPLAATFVLVTLAQLTMALCNLDEFSEHAFCLGAAVLLLTFPLMRRLFLRSRDRMEAYRRAVLWPPLIGALLAPSIAIGLSLAMPRAALTFGGVGVKQVGGVWPVHFAVLGALAGVAGSAVMLCLVRLVIHARDTEGTGESRWLAPVGWMTALALALTARGITTPGYGTSVLASAIAAGLGLLVACSGWLVEARARALPIQGPYRAPSAR